VNSEYCKQALAKVINPNTLVNLVSRRVRQLTAGGGAHSRPLISDVGNLGAADIALLEIIEGKMSWEVPLQKDIAIEEAARKLHKKG
jgi:DNA-directed RNA polymerase subunit omega